MATSKKGSKNSKLGRKVEENIYDAADSLQEKAENTYYSVLDRLQYDRDEVERILKHEYRSARRYIRAHPEQGVGLAFIAGLALGVLLSSGGKD